MNSSAQLTLSQRVDRLIRNTRTPGKPRELLPPEEDNVSASLAALSKVAIQAPEPSPPPIETPPVPLVGGSARVLVVESDPLHRQVLARLVEKSGYGVDTASSAEAAIAAFRPQTYALVLLDCDGAATSGMETAATLRQMENGSGRTPIVAITWSAAQSQRKRRKAAGIDNYLSKPVLKENVASILARYVPLVSAAKQSRYLALDRHRLEELDELAGDRPELLCEWIGLFLSGAPELLDRMRSAQEDGNGEALQDAANQLRSRSGQFGALRVQEISGIVGALSESRNLAGVESLLPELALAVDRAARELRSLEVDIRSGLRLGGVVAAQSGASTSDTQILLVEADPLVSRFLVNSLSGAGFEVTHLTAGRSALDEARGRKFGAAIVDLVVPEVDGYGILSEMRAAPGDNIPVLILSSRRQEQDILRAFELGADDYVTIPFNPLEVVARVRRLVKQGAHVA